MPTGRAPDDEEAPEPRDRESGAVDAAAGVDPTIEDASGDEETSENERTDESDTVGENEPTDGNATAENSVAENAASETVGAANAAADDSPPGVESDASAGSDVPAATGTADGASAADGPATADATQEPAGKQSKGLDEKYCSTCGEIIKKAAEICPECGVRQQGAPSTADEKDPGIAAVISAITGGWGGQLYNGEIGKGIGLLLLQFVNFLLAAVFIGFLTGFVVWIVGIYDAYNAAQKINRGERSP